MNFYLFLFNFYFIKYKIFIFYLFKKYIQIDVFLIVGLTWCPKATKEIWVMIDSKTWLRVCLPMQETWVPSLGQKIPCRKKWQPTPVFLTGESHGQRSLAVIVRGVAKRQTQLSDKTIRRTIPHHFIPSFLLSSPASCL